MTASATESKEQLDAIPPAGGRISILLATTFPAPAPSTPTRWWLAVLAAVAAVAGSLGRVGGHGPFDTVWIEDAVLFLDQAINESWKDTVFRPHNGYWHIGPRTLTEVADLFPLAYVPAVMTILAAIMLSCFAFVAYYGSRAFFENKWLRLMIAASVLLVPVGQSQMQVDLATLHFPGLYAMFWLCFWRPVTRAGKIAAPLITTYLVFSSILNVLFAPLLLLRLVAVRDWATRLIALAYAAGMTLQLGGVVTGYNQRVSGEPNYNPILLLSEYVRVAMPRAFFGEYWAGYNTIRPHWTWVVAAVLVVLAVLWVAVRGLSRPAWPLAAVALVLSVVNFATQVGSMGWIEPRYVAVPALLLYVAVLALIRPHSGTSAWAPAGRVATVAVISFTLLLGSVFITNYRSDSSRSTGPSWQSAMHDADVACNADPNLTSHRWAYIWWYVNFPCKDFRP
ncbi:hypothetical protein GCM10010399_71650 [Dactylosporangium fulvum]|uniref:Integral membrane protein n=1 Tax=Dactylosporangium fulvum TaxID=53359 RepID=A0ABY5VWI4_9ACTN|nr:hypothetical protein [Dactylosporangium fulvum]UWP82163.1 hypothetical protein Dfulv_45055 [Dactylosporangium fulvum]